MNKTHIAKWLMYIYQTVSVDTVSIFDGMKIE